ncbi:predicted protein [Plenodomus lingam JN3]|uniref:Predicted protein n=1 Tax=Leptosphaeria maculans (strain JN3 / isolate v23.1.3 / race Av1-4-5-6-7-8) TaxID=985895 RepID=E5A2E1_LEPMJ|nr:predicted protein [Plenodomus lingam JN3]CBX97576.1 predicted protein [Plenodomus lingam JN3]
MFSRCSTTQVLFVGSGRISLCPKSATTIGSSHKEYQDRQRNKSLQNPRRADLRSQDFHPGGTSYNRLNVQIFAKRQAAC